jgi:RNA polymerase primary sigma factor
MVDYKENPILEAYFRDIRKYEVLSAEDQKNIAVDIQSHLVKIDQYNQRLANPGVRKHTKLRLREELPSLYGELRDLKSSLVKSNLRFVVNRAKNHKKQELELLDLIQESSIQMYDKATELYNPDHEAGSKFTTYAAWWMFQGMNRATEDQSRTVRAPNDIHATMTKITIFSNKFFIKNERYPFPEEISKSLNIDLGKINSVLTTMQDFVSLDIPLSEGSEDTIADRICDEKEIISTAENGYRHTVNSLIENTKLTQREGKVIQSRFGLKTREPKTLEEVGLKWGLTRERIRQIEAKAIKKLRKTASNFDLKLEDIL